MAFLGICRESGAVYEGASPQSGYRVQPAPILTPVRFATNGAIPSLHRDAFLPAESLFREYDFDPITKIRRGVVYTRRNQSQPWGWYVQDPLRQDLIRIGIGGSGRASAQEISLNTYQTDSLTDLATSKHPVRPRVILGWEPFDTHWLVISIEHNAASYPVLTLRAHHLLNDIPELNLSGIPPHAQSSITEAMQKVDASMNRLSSTEVVDRCRDALSIVFGALTDDMTKDLGAAISAYTATTGNKDDMRSLAGKLVARLHSRAKPNEQHARGLKPPTDDDAMLAVRCLRFVLSEFDWAK